MTITNTPISFIEAHDSHMDRMTIALGDSAELHFDELMVYHYVDTDKSAVWIYQAALVLTAVSSISVHGSLLPHIDLDDGAVLNGDTDLNWADLLEPQPATRVTISFLNGSSIEVHCSSAHLLLQTPVRYLEEWVEPL